MKQEIKYQGYTAQPSDYECQDGDLADSMNLIHEDGSLKPIFQPKAVMQLEPAEKIMFIHATPVFKHYIVLNAGGNTLWWIDERDTEATRHLIDVDPPFTVVHKINAVGNTLCVLCGDGLHYILWKPNDESYLYLGTKPEMLQLSFGLSQNYYGHYTHDGDDNEAFHRQDLKTNFSSYIMDEDEDIGYFFERANTGELTTLHVKESHKEKLHDIIFGLVNKTYNIVSRDGHFYAPFFVRYCYRMYDGTMWMHSAPVFMPVSMPLTYNMALKLYTENGSIYDYDNQCHNNTLYFFPQNVALTCRLVDGSINELKDRWGDVIKSIDIFVSLPVMREQTGEKIEFASVGGAATTYTLAGTGLTHQDHRKMAIDDNNPTPHALYPDERDHGLYNFDVLVEFPMLSDDSYYEKIITVANFYKIKSIELENFDFDESTYKEISIDRYKMLNLATQEVMKDDYKSHNTILPLNDDNNDCVTSIYNYNQRENVASIREKLFSGFPAISLTPRCRNYSSEPSREYDYFRVIMLTVVLRTEEGEKKVSVFTPLNGAWNSRIKKPILYNCPLFYPDSRAIRMELYVKEDDSGNIYRYNIKMKTHPMLNGAISEGGIFNNLTDFYTRDFSPVSPVAYSSSVIVPYKVYTSEVNNPFYFPPTGINTVGTGTILGLCAATKALSQGQFGQFPLYAFTTDGVWALSISDTGTVSAAHPVTRDVVLNAESITQLDSSVVFATSRGIMHIVGSEATCISDFLNSPDPFDFSNLPSAERLQEINPQITPIAPFLDFLAESRMVYDYLHQRIILYNPSIQHGPGTLIYPYAYVYSLKSKLWGTMHSDLSYTINSYPEAMAVNHDNNLVTLFDTNETISNGFAITRPIKLGDGNTLKSIHMLMQRGYFSRGDVYTVLYGSRDLMTWHTIASSRDHAIHNVRGTAYKYFRIAAFTNFTKEKSLSGASAEFEPRHLNVLH